MDVVVHLNSSSPPSSFPLIILAWDLNVKSLLLVLIRPIILYITNYCILYCNVVLYCVLFSRQPIVWGSDFWLTFLAALFFQHLVSKMPHQWLIYVNFYLLKILFLSFYLIFNNQILKYIETSDTTKASGNIICNRWHWSFWSLPLYCNLMREVVNYIFILHYLSVFFWSRYYHLEALKKTWWQDERWRDFVYFPFNGLF